MKMSHNNVSLKWKDFHTSLPFSFQDARLSNEFCDVTLVCDDDTALEAHRVILVAGSIFFKKVLSSVRTNSHPHPMLCLKDFHKEDLTAMLDFLYSGEARVQEETLNRFMTQAQQLGIKGLVGEQNVDMSQQQNYSEENTLIEADTTRTKFECGLESEQEHNMPLEDMNIREIKLDVPVDDSDDLKLRLEALQKKLLKQEAKFQSKWILQNVNTFPKLPMPLKKLMYSANTIRPYTTQVMDWFLKPLGLKPGRNSFAGWEFLVNPADFIYTKNILKELNGCDFSLADIIEWSSLHNYGSKKRGGFGQGNTENLKKTSGVTSWFGFLKVFLEWAFIVVDIQPDTWVLDEFAL